VKSDESINVGIRDDANRSLQDAQTFLERLKPALPDLTGTWKLNPSMSKIDTFGFGSSPDVLVVKHSGANLTMRHSTSPLGGETYSYVIDGKEHLAKFTKKNEFTQANAYWDGNTLVIEKHHQTKIGDFPWPEVFVTSRYSLSADGETLSVVNEAGYHAVLIYDKQ